MFASKAGAYLSEAPFKYSTLGKLLALPTNIRLGWKGLPGTIALACIKSHIYVRKKFYDIGQWLYFLALKQNKMVKIISIIKILHCNHTNVTSHFYVTLK
jgi:hypothetical protein